MQIILFNFSVTEFLQNFPELDPFRHSQRLKNSSEFEIEKDAPTDWHVAGKLTDVIEKETEDGIAFEDGSCGDLDKGRRELCNVFDILEGIGGDL